MKKENEEKSLWLVLHETADGVTYSTVSAKERPSVEEVVKKTGIYFVPKDGDRVIIYPVDLGSVIDLDDWDNITVKTYAYIGVFIQE